MRLPTLADAMRRHGWSHDRPLTRSQVYEANVVTPSQLAEFREEEAWLERSRRRDEAARRRREREDGWADEWGAAHAAR